MTNDDRTPGVCPNCGHRIRKPDELISFERSDNSIGRFAKCPSCGDVVEPE